MYQTKLKKVVVKLVFKRFRLFPLNLFGIKTNVCDSVKKNNNSTFSRVKWHPIDFRKLTPLVFSYFESGSKTS